MWDGDEDLDTRVVVYDYLYECVEGHDIDFDFPDLLLQVCEN